MKSHTLFRMLAKLYLQITTHRDETFIRSEIKKKKKNFILGSKFLIYFEISLRQFGFQCELFYLEIRIYKKGLFSWWYCPGELLINYLGRRYHTRICKQLRMCFYRLRLDHYVRNEFRIPLPNTIFRILVLNLSDKMSKIIQAITNIQTITKTKMKHQIYHFA